MKPYFLTTKIAIAFSDTRQHQQLLDYFGKRYIPAQRNGIVSFFVEMIPIKNGIAFESYRYGEISDPTVMPDYEIITYNEFLWLTCEQTIWPASQLLPANTNK